MPSNFTTSCAALDDQGLVQRVKDTLLTMQDECSDREAQRLQACLDACKAEAESRSDISLYQQGFDAARRALGLASLS